MHLGYFGRNEQPFAPLLDSRFFCNSSSHEAVLASLAHAVDAACGSVVIVGDRGLGKTMVLMRLRGHFRDPAGTEFLVQTAGSPQAFLERLLTDMGVKPLDRTACDLQTQDSPRFEKFRHSLSAITHIPPLCEDDVAKYVDHRLRVAGHEGTQLFTPEAVQHIAERSGGVAAIIICFDALLLAFLKNRESIDEVTCQEAITNLQLEYPEAKPKKTPTATVIAGAPPMDKRVAPAEEPTAFSAPPSRSQLDGDPELAVGDVKTDSDSAGQGHIQAVLPVGWHICKIVPKPGGEPSISGLYLRSGEALGKKFRVSTSTPSLQCSSTLQEAGTFR